MTKFADWDVQDTASLDEFIAKRSKSHAAQVMVPGETGEEVASRREAGNIIIDDGNTYYRDDLERGQALKARDIPYVDCGTSGGIFGLEHGYCLMISCEGKIVKHLDPIFNSIAPAIKAAPRTPGRTGASGHDEQAYLHCGQTGAGNFLKMVHNGIEYGLMAAYAEGLNILKHADVGLRDQEKDAEATPLRDLEAYQYQIDVGQVAEVWRRGSVVASWLLDLTAEALVEDPDLTSFSGRVSDFGEGRWTIAAGVDEGVAAPVLSADLFGQFEFRGKADYADRILSVLRKQFGGHDEKKEES